MNWDKASFLTQLHAHRSPEDAAIVMRLMQALEDRGILDWPPKGKDASFKTKAKRRIIQYWAQGTGTGASNLRFIMAIIALPIRPRITYSRTKGSGNMFLKN